MKLVTIEKARKHIVVEVTHSFAIDVDIECLHEELGRRPTKEDILNYANDSAGRGDNRTPFEMKQRIVDHFEEPKKTILRA